MRGAGALRVPGRHRLGGAPTASVALRDGVPGTALRDGVPRGGPKERGAPGRPQGERGPAAGTGWRGPDGGRGPGTPPPRVPGEGDAGRPAPSAVRPGLPEPVGSRAAGGTGFCSPRRRVSSPWPECFSGNWFQTGACASQRGVLFGSRQVAAETRVCVYTGAGLATFPGAAVARSAAPGGGARPVRTPRGLRCPTPGRRPARAALSVGFLRLFGPLAAVGCVCA